MTDNITYNITSKIVIMEECDKDKIYLISLATREEIIRGEYVEINGLKISKNKKKYGLIKDIEND